MMVVVEVAVGGGAGTGKKNAQEVRRDGGSGSDVTVTSYTWYSGRSDHGICAVEAMFGTAVVVVAVTRSARRERHLVSVRTVGDEVVSGLALVTPFGQRPVRTLGGDVVGKVPAVVTPVTQKRKYKHCSGEKNRLGKPVSLSLTHHEVFVYVMFYLLCDE